MLNELKDKKNIYKLHLNSEKKLLRVMQGFAFQNFYSKKIIKYDIEKLNKNNNCKKKTQNKILSFNDLQRNNFNFIKLLLIRCIFSSYRIIISFHFSFFIVV